MLYRAIAQTWHDFFLVAGTAAATLVGLLFVSLSLHLRAVISRLEVRGLARATLTNFALVLVVALFIAIPQDAQSSGIELVITGVASLGIIAAPILAARRSRTRTMRLPILILRFGSSVLGYMGVLAAGVLMMAGSYNAAFIVVVAVVITLLLISLRNTWDLLVSVGEATMEHEPPGRQ